jgi:hypothetical protein
VDRGAVDRGAAEPRAPAAAGGDPGGPLACVDASWEWMRKATLSNATVNTMSRAKRMTSIRKPAARTDKLHHGDRAATKIIRLNGRSCRAGRPYRNGTPTRPPSTATPVISHAT